MVLGGAAIRAYEMARGLTGVAEVTLAAPGKEPPGLAPARHVPFALDDPRPLRGLFEASDVVIMRPPNPVVGGWLRKSRARIVFDLYDPLPLDILELFFLTPLPGSEDHKVLWQNGVWMDPDMNKYDLNHRVAHHPKMSDAEWEDAYRAAWEKPHVPRGHRTMRGAQHIRA